MRKNGTHKGFNVSTPPIHAIYASTSGNTELVIERIAETWKQQGLAVELHRAEQTDPEVIKQNSLFLLGTSTWEHGQLNPFFKKLFDALKEIDCINKSAFFVGLGDMRYEPVLFCGGMELLKERWLSRQGVQLSESLKINGEPHSLLPTIVTQWAEQAGALLQKSESMTAAYTTNVTNPHTEIDEEHGQFI